MYPLPAKVAKVGWLPKGSGFRKQPLLVMVARNCTSDQLAKGFLILTAVVHPLVHVYELYAPFLSLGLPATQHKKLSMLCKWCLGLEQKDSDVACKIPWHRSLDENPGHPFLYMHRKSQVHTWLSFSGHHLYISVVSLKGAQATHLPFILGDPGSHVWQ